MTAEATTGKQRGRPFKRGQSGNPAGRPKGIRNKATMAAQTLLDGEAEALTRKCVEMALEGDSSAMRLCLERLVPPAKESAIEADSVRLPPISAKNLPACVAALTRAVAGGRLRPSEGRALADLLGTYSKAVEIYEIERRIVALEGSGGEREDD